MIGSIIMSFQITSNPLGRILCFLSAPPRTFSAFRAADSVNGQSLPITGLEGTFSYYLTQRFHSLEESSGREFLPAENPFQSLDRIPRPVDIYPRNHRDFWAAGAF